jgi:predicted flavoprotein YhiN
MDGFISRFGHNGRFLYSAFSRFFRVDLIALLQRYGVSCRTAPNGKIYPASDRARDVVRALQKYLEAGKVTIRFNTALTGINVVDGKVTGIETTGGCVPTNALIVASGGSSHPQTGSDGSGYNIIASLGHTIIKLRPGLVPLVVKDIEKAGQMQGASLRQARITAFHCPAEKIDVSLVPAKDTGLRLPGKRPRLPVIESRTGDAIITHFGLSGPVVLEMSLAIVDALEDGPVSVSIDLHPAKDRAALRVEFQQALDQYHNQFCRHIVRRFAPQKMVETIMKMANVPPEKRSSQVNSEEREALLEQIKSLRFDIQGPYSMETAMVTAGGVSLKEVDPRTMESKIIKGLYLCGEVLDLDAGTGGFNLQAAFSTGYIAGESVAMVLSKAL